MRRRCRRSRDRSCSLPATSKHDIAYANGKSTFEAINHTPIFYGWQNDLQHIGTFGAKNGGDNGVIARNWLEWTTRNDQNAGRMFKGAGCTLCKDPAWHIQKKRIDDRPGTRAPLIVAVREKVGDVPVAGARHRHVAARADFEQIGPVRGERRLQRRRQVAGASTRADSTPNARASIGKSGL